MILTIGLCIIGYLLFGFLVSILGMFLTIKSYNHENKSRRYVIIDLSDPEDCIVVTILWPFAILFFLFLKVLHIVLKIYENIFSRLYKKYYEKSKE